MKETVESKNQYGGEIVRNSLHSIRLGREGEGDVGNDFEVWSLDDCRMSWRHSQEQ